MAEKEKPEVVFGSIAPARIPALWSACREILLPAFRYRVQEHTVDDYYEPLLKGELQLWGAFQNSTIIGAAVTSIDQGSAAKVCSILSLAGSDLPAWIDQVNALITQFAADHQCTAVQAVTRRGFSRFVPDFVEDGVVYVKIIGSSHG